MLKNHCDPADRAKIVFGVLASLIVTAFSRQREFRADAGGARLAGTQRMIDALEALKRPSGNPRRFPTYV